MICKKCNQDGGDGKFCRECGSPLNVINDVKECPYCHTKTMGKFCSECGAKLHVATITINEDNLTIEGTTLIKCDESATEVIIPNYVTEIGEGAFAECEELQSVVIPNSVTSIGNFAFIECEKLSNLTIPNSVVYIGEDAFRSCFNLKKIVIPNSVTSIQPGAFSCDLDSISVDKQNPNYYSSGNCVIEKSTGKLIVGTYNSVIPTDGSVTCIDWYSFSYSYSLRSFVIPRTVTSIGISAFSECWNLSKITIPNSVTKIGDGAFYCCNSLKTITFLGTKEQWDAISKDGWNETNDHKYLDCKIIFTEDY